MGVMVGGKKGGFRYLVFFFFESQKNWAGFHEQMSALEILGYPEDSFGVYKYGYIFFFDLQAVQSCWRHIPTCFLHQSIRFVSLARYIIMT